MDFYPWVVVAHVFCVIVAFGAHGASAFAMFGVRAERDRAKIGAVLDLSAMAVVVAGIFLVLAIVLGIIAALMGSHFSRLWPWVAIGVVTLVWVLMTPLAAGPMGEVRKALGMSVRQDRKGDPPRQPGSDADLAAAQARLRPEPVAALGIAAIAVLVWLMESKPF
jgi:hypothetical protein